MYWISRRLPYEYNLPLFLVTFLDPDTKEPISACPRGLLERTVDKIRAHDGQQWECMAGVEYEYFQLRETPESVEEKGFVGLKALTPGMHGYSMLRPSLNNAYFHELMDNAAAFGIDVEAHRESTSPLSCHRRPSLTQASVRHGDGPGSL